MSEIRVFAVVGIGKSHAMELFWVYGHPQSSDVCDYCIEYLASSIERHLVYVQVTSKGNFVPASLLSVMDVLLRLTLSTTSLDGL